MVINFILTHSRFSLLTVLLISRPACNILDYNTNTVPEFEKWRNKGRVKGCPQKVQCCLKAGKISSRKELNREVTQKQNLERKRCADDHENDDFDITTKTFLWLKMLWCKKSYLQPSRFGLLKLTSTLFIMSIFIKFLSMPGVHTCI